MAQVRRLRYQSLETSRNIAFRPALMNIDRSPIKMPRAHTGASPFAARCRVRDENDEQRARTANNNVSRATTSDASLLLFAGVINFNMACDFADALLQLLGANRCGCEKRGARTRASDTVEMGSLWWIFFVVTGL